MGCLYKRINVYSLKFFVIFLSVSVLWTESGCYSYTGGDLVRLDPIKDTRVVESADYRIVKVGDPSVDNPVSKFEIEKKLNYRTQAIEKLAELKKKNYNGIAWLFLGLGSASLLFGLQQMKSQDSLTHNLGALLTIVGAIGAGLGSLSLATPSSKNTASPGEPTGRLIDGKRTTISSSSSWMPAPFEKAKVSNYNNSMNHSKTYTADSLGVFKVDMPADLGLTTFDEPTRVDLFIQGDGYTFSKYFSFKNTQWMTRYFRVTKKSSSAYQNRNFRGNLVKQLDYGEVYNTLKLEGSWVEIKIASQNAWVKSEDGKLFWSTSTYLNPNFLPHLDASIKFEEPSGNNILDANETGSVILKIHNEGSGIAYRVSTHIVPNSITDLNYEADKYLGDIQPGETKTVNIPISANLNVKTATDSLVFGFTEANGFEPSPIQLIFSTGKFLPPHLEISGVGIDDANGNGMIDPGELVKVTARVKNDGLGVATNVRAHIIIGENLFITQNSQTNFDLDTLQPGQEKDIQFSIVSNMRATSVPAYVDLSEHYGKYGEKGIQLPLAFNKRMNSLQQIVVSPKKTNTVAVPALGSLTPEIETRIPTAQIKDPNAVALVIGISNYSNPGVPRVLYAKRDAAIVREYLIKALGYDPQNILPRDPDELMTAGAMKTYLKQVLPSYLKPDGSSDVFIYYTGHGAPRLKDQEPFLVPYDCDPNFVNKDNAYDLKEFYTDISNLNARHKIVVVDACFSGVAGNGVSLLHNVSAGMLMLKNPIYADSKTVIFQSSKSDQVSNWYPEEKHSMFTYFFLKGLHGGADKNGDGIITANELMNYIDNPDSGLPYYSNRLFQRPQDAQLTGNRNMVIEDIKK